MPALRMPPPLPLLPQPPLTPQPQPQPQPRLLAMASPPPADPPPPKDAPPPPGGLDNSSSQRKLSSTEPRFPELMSSPRRDAAEPTIKDIARDVVAAELGAGLKLNTIGRGNPKLNGVSAYQGVARHVNREMARSGFIDIVDRARREVLERFGKKPDKLIAREGSTTAEAGEHTGVDLKRIKTYVNPILEFVCGSAQRFADSRLPAQVLALLKAIDRELVAQLLSRRKDQLRAQDLWSKALPPDELKETLKKYEWSESHYRTLVDEGVYSAAKIHAFRANMFAGVLFTRCVSPFIMFSPEELAQDSAVRQASPPKPLVKLSEGANKLFKKNYGEFIEDFVNDSSKYLPEQSAETLATIIRSEKRISSVKKSKKAPPGGGKSYARPSGRHSAPVLPQGGDFRKLMAQEKTAVDAEAAQSGRAVEEADYKSRRDAAIDKFKSGHASDFSDENFAIAFSGKLRKWKREAGEVSVEGIGEAMQTLHRQVKMEIARRRETARGGPSVESPPARPHGGARQKSSTSTAASGGTSALASQPDAEFTLDQSRTGTLNKFIGKAERRASFERYPELESRIRIEALSWAKAGAVGNFVMALKKIFEEELLKCFYQSYLVLGGPEALSLEELQAKVREWKKNPDNLGKPVHLDELRDIMPNFLPALMVPGATQSALTRNAEATTERFMRRSDVAAELQNNAALRKAYLHDIRSWIAQGAYSPQPDMVVQQTYHEALTCQYVEKLNRGGVDSRLSARLRLAAAEWWVENEARLLTTAVLDALFRDIIKEQ